jgi:predicted nicotinamide N-methyase
MRLYLADEIYGVWHATQQATGDDDAPIPFWAFAWGGGLAIAHYLQGRPEACAGKRVLDLASGSGLCAIAAMQAGAAEATAVDIDPFAVAAISLNARANGVRVDAVRADMLGDAPPADVDLILAGDCWYEEQFGARVTAWLRGAHHAGIAVLIGDPGRRYLPLESLVELATYEVRSTTTLEDLGRTTASVYALR